MRVYINFDESAHTFTRDTISNSKIFDEAKFKKIYFIVKQKINISIFKEIML